MLRTEIQLNRVTCPKCKGPSYIKEWEPEKCPHCNANLKYYTDGELEPHNETVTVAINQLTGEAAVIENVREAV